MVPGAVLSMTTAPLFAGIGGRHSAPRRLDLSLARVDELVETLSAEERATLTAGRAWSALTILSRLRGMEMAEEAVLGRPVSPTADAYDRLVRPGEPLLEGLLRVFRDVMTAAREAP